MNAVEGLFGKGNNNFDLMLDFMEDIINGLNRDRCKILGLLLNNLTTILRSLVKYLKKKDIYL